MFITFEGGEGCGKSTHSKLLREYLKSKGYKVVLTLEPGGTMIGRKLRKYLLKGKKLCSKFTELFLFAADRLEHIEQVIKPAIKAGKIVISDRYIDSTTAYQMGGRKLPSKLIHLVNQISSCGVKPDITILLDVDPKKGIYRGTKYTGKDKFESEDRAFHNRVRKAYLSAARKDPKRIKLISTSQPIHSVQTAIRRIIDEKLGN